MADSKVSGHRSRAPTRACWTALLPRSPDVRIRIPAEALFDLIVGSDRLCRPAKLLERASFAVQHVRHGASDSSVFRPTEATHHFLAEGDPLIVASQPAKHVGLTE
jgi:hypothetical protein